MSAHMGPPAVIPLRDVPCVMILLHSVTSDSFLLSLLPSQLSLGL